MARRLENGYSFIDMRHGRPSLGYGRDFLRVSFPEEYSLFYRIDLENLRPLQDQSPSLFYDSLDNHTIGRRTFAGGAVIKRVADHKPDCRNRVVLSSDDWKEVEEAIVKYLTEEKSLQRVN